MILYRGDCLEEMNKIPDKSISMILCDLPYGTTSCRWDVLIPFNLLWAHYNRVIKDNGAIVLFCTEPFTSLLIQSNLSMFKYKWIWTHNHAANFAQAPYMPMKNYEELAVFSKGGMTKNSLNRMQYNPQGIEDTHKVWGGVPESPHRPGRKKQGKYVQTKTGYPRMVIDFPKENNKWHPTKKPVALLEYLVKTYTDVDEVVLDNTMGGGSTGVACVNTNRRFIGIELDENYYDIAYQRIANAIPNNKRTIS